MQLTGTAAGVPFAALPPAGGARPDAVRKVHRHVTLGALAGFPAAYVAARAQLGIAGDVPLGVMGGSMGGAAAQLVLADGGAGARAAALINPVVRFRVMIDALAARFGTTYTWTPEAEAVAERMDFVRAVAVPGGDSLLVSGRAIRAEHRLHLADTKARRRATATRAPSRGQRGSRRWRKTRRRARLVEGRHRRRVRQALHEAAVTVISWAVQHRIGTLTVGDPRGVLAKPAGRRHNLRLRQWQIGRTLQILQDKAVLAGITVHLVDERGTSSTCPTCRQKISKPRGRVMTCTRCEFVGHRDLAAAFTIAARTPGDAPTTPPLCDGGVVTHRRAGRHLPGVHPARRDPRRRPPRPATPGSVGRRRPAPPLVGSRSSTPTDEDPQHHRTQPGQRSWTPH